MHVGELLELESALQSDRIADVPAEEEHGPGVGEGAGKRPHRFDRGQGLAHQGGHGLQLLDVPGDLVAVEHPPDLRQVQPDQQARGHLAEEGLRRGHPDLGAAAGVQDGVGLPRDRRPVRVADRQHPGLLLPGVLDRHQGVERLTALADGHDKRGTVQDRVAVAELRGHLHLAGQPRPVFDGVFGDESGVVGRAAGDDEHLVHVTEVLGGQAFLVEDDLGVVGEASTQGVGEGGRLLADLLEHEVGVAALLRGAGVPVDVVRTALDRVAGEVGDSHAIAAGLDDLVLADLHGAAGVRDEGRDVTGQEGLVGADADHERAVAPRPDHHVGMVPVHHDQREGAFQTAAHPAEGLGQPARPGRLGSLSGPSPSGPVRGAHRGEFVLQQVRDDLGVGLAGEFVPVALEAGPQAREILDDPIVDHGDGAGAVGVRMRVGVRRPAVRRPAGMTDTDGSPRAGRRFGQRLFQVGQFARSAQSMQPAVDDHGHARRVVAPVFQPAKPGQSHLERGLSPDVPDDPTHAVSVRNQRPGPTGEDSLRAFAFADGNSRVRRW